jgi:hypothetical protein
VTSVGYISAIISDYTSIFSREREKEEGERETRRYCGAAFHRTD